MSDSDASSAQERAYRSYDRHLSSRGRAEPDRAAAEANPRRYATPEPWWPESRDGRVLDVGCGWGGDLLNMWAGGFRDLTGVDSSVANVTIARRSSPEGTNIVGADAMEYLADHEGEFDLILCFDVVEHFTVDDGLKLAELIHGALRPGGACVMRTPNMGSLLGTFSRYIDLTHLTGYTESSLCQLLTVAGFAECRTMHLALPPLLRGWRPWIPWRGFAVRERVRRRLNALVHRILFRLRGQRGQSGYERNIIIRSRKRAADAGPPA